MQFSPPDRTTALFDIGDETDSIRTNSPTRKNDPTGRICRNWGRTPRSPKQGSPWEINYQGRRTDFQSVPQPRTDWKSVLRVDHFLLTGCASQFWVKSNERVVVDSEGARRAADECLSPYKHDAQASVSENSLACAACLYLAQRAGLTIPAARPRVAASSTDWDEPPFGFHPES